MKSDDPRYSKPSKCRSCSAPIYWIPNEKTGKNAPIDATPTNEGNITLKYGGPGDLLKGFDPDAPPVYQVNSKKVLTALRNDAGTKLYNSHFRTCPQGKKW